MNKKALVVLSCLLVNMPTFAKGLFHERLMQTHRHSLVKNVSETPDFSGSWIGKCNISQEEFSLNVNIVQNNKDITLSYDYGADNDLSESTFKFPIENVKIKSASAIDSSGHSMSSALWSYPGDRLSIFMKRISMESCNGGKSNYVSISSFEVDLALENGKLFFYSAYGEKPICSFDKQA